MTMRWLLVSLAWLVSTAVMGSLMFAVAIVLAGPHSSMLPSSIQPVVLLIAWTVFLVGPLMVARAVWRRAPATGSRTSSTIDPSRQSGA